MKQALQDFVDEVNEIYYDEIYYLQPQDGAGSSPELDAVISMMIKDSFYD